MDFLRATQFRDERAGWEKERGRRDGSNVYSRKIHSKISARVPSIFFLKNLLRCNGDTIIPLFHPSKFDLFVRWITHSERYVCRTIGFDGDEKEVPSTISLWSHCQAIQMGQGTECARSDRRLIVGVAFDPEATLCTAINPRRWKSEPVFTDARSRREFVPS